MVSRPNLPLSSLDLWLALLYPDIGSWRRRPGLYQRSFLCSTFLGVWPVRTLTGEQSKGAEVEGIELELKIQDVLSSFLLGGF